MRRVSVGTNQPQAKQAVHLKKPQAGNPETALIWDLGLIICVWLCPSALPSLTLVFQYVCNTARVGIKDLRGVFELWNPILNFFSWLCEFLLLSTSRTSLHCWHYWQQSPSEYSFLGFYSEGDSGSHSIDSCPQSWLALVAQFLNSHSLF